VNPRTNRALPNRQKNILRENAGLSGSTVANQRPYAGLMPVSAGLAPVSAGSEPPSAGFAGSFLCHLCLWNLSFAGPVTTDLVGSLPR
jgi:hypothetical protein